MVSEIRLLDFFTQTLKLPEVQAREAVREFKTAEAEMHTGFTQTIDKKFEERRDTFATKQDVMMAKEDLLQVKEDLLQKISTLEVRMEQNANKIVFWLLGTIFAASGLIVALIKLL